MGILRLIAATTPVVSSHLGTVAVFLGEGFRLGDALTFSRNFGDIFGMGSFRFGDGFGDSFGDGFGDCLGVVGGVDSFAINCRPLGLLVQSLIFLSFAILAGEFGIGGKGSFSILSSASAEIEISRSSTFCSTVTGANGFDVVVMLMPGI